MVRKSPLCAHRAPPAKANKIIRFSTKTLHRIRRFLRRTARPCRITARCASSLRPSSFLQPPRTAATEREVAEWVLRWEGSLILEGSNEPIRDLSQLPPGDFHIASIDLTAAVMRPVELRKLEGLTHLRQLYLPGRIWNPGAGNEDKTGVFEALASLTSVERLAFGWHFNSNIEVDDKDIDKLAPWSGLKQLRCSQCSLAKPKLSVFSQLRDLDLSDNPFTDEGMASLAGLKNLRRLILRTRWSPTMA